MKKAIFAGLLGLILLGLAYQQISAHGQKSLFLGNIWQTLLKVTWQKKYNADLKVQIEYPKFSPEVQALAGKEITITGYVIPSDLYEGDFVVLSAFPVSNCYFCGGAGPESVMEVYPKNQRRSFATEKVTFKGKLKLNANDHTHLIYILQEAIQVFEED
ncbi:MAG: hypothetical protein MUE85_10050 [Microscillaceae bacterium]|jgi:hypothetical protein|nr:hypothetical protein [Microscillaceae bacterium]